MNPTWLYVGVLYAVAVGVIRRFEPALRRRVAALFYLLVLGFLFRPMTGDWVNLGTDVIDLVGPWSVHSRFTKLTVANPMLQDPPLQMVPWAHEVRQAWRSGRLPLWQDLTQCGGPLLGNGQSAALSPLRLAMLPLPLGQSMTGEAAAKLLIALTFTYLYCRRRRYSEWASLVAALSFGFSLFLVVWLHFAMATVAAFLPVVFYSIDVLAERQSPWRVAFAAIAWAITLFGGHIETAVHIAVLSSLYVLWIAAFETTDARWRFLLAIVVTAGAAAIIASPLLIALGETIVRSRRFAELRSTPYFRIPFSDYPSLFLSLQPRFFGSTPVKFFGPAHAESISGFAGVLGVAGAVCALRRAAFRRPWRHVETFFAVAWVLALLVIADVSWMRGIANTLVPFTAHARVRVLLCWLTALLAAALIDSFRNLISVLTGTVTVVLILAFTIAKIGMPDPETQRAAIETSIPAFAVLVIASALVVPRWRRVLLPVTAALVLIELWLPAYRWNPVRRSETLFPTRPIVKALQALDPGHERFVGIKEQLFPNTNAMFDLPDIRYNDPTVLWKYVDTLTQAAGYDQSAYYANWYNTDTPFLDFLNVRWVATMPEGPRLHSSRYRLAFEGFDGRIYENRHVLPRFFAVPNVEVERDKARFDQVLKANRDWGATAVVRGLPQDPRIARDLFASHAGEAAPRVSVDSGAATRYALTVHSPRFALVVSSVPMYPGWRALAGSRSLRPIEVNGAFLGFVVPPGTTRIDVAYRPTHIYAACLASLLTTLALAISAARLSRRSSASRPE